METALTSSKISRVDIRYRHLAQDVSPREEVVREEEPEEREKEEEQFAENADDPLLIREEKRRSIMGKAHRLFHKRQESPPSRVKTVIVQVFASPDANRGVVSQETQTPQGDTPPAVPLPTVPAVPPFPTNLVVPTVPAYPWPSGVSSLDPTSLSLSTPTPNPTAALLTSHGYNSTIPSTTLSSSLSANRTTTTSTSLTTTTTSPSSSRQSLTSSPVSSSHPASSSPAVTPAVAPGSPAPPGEAAPTSPAANSGADTENTPLPTPAVVGSVIGSLAGAALFLFLILFLIKRHKRKGSVRLSAIDTLDNQPIAASGSQMASRSSFIPATATAFLNRFSGASRSTTDTSTTGERGFQRVSGRKLPSAFSAGMTSEQFARGEGTLSETSFYRDDQGFYGGPGIGPSKEIGKESGEPSGYGAVGMKERIMPSPARTPVIHHPDDAPPWGTSRNGGSTLSPPHSPNPDPKPSLGRSHPSHDGSRSSRFTENV